MSDANRNMIDFKTGAIATVGVMPQAIAFFNNPNWFSFLTTAGSGLLIAVVVKLIDISYKEYVRRQELNIKDEEKGRQ